MRNMGMGGTYPGAQPGHIKMAIFVDVHLTYYGLMTKNSIATGGQPYLYRSKSGKAAQKGSTLCRSGHFLRSSKLLGPRGDGNMWHGQNSKHQMLGWGTYRYTPILCCIYVILYYLDISYHIIRYSYIVCILLSYYICTYSMCAYLLTNHYINKPGFIWVPAPTPPPKKVKSTS